jgi:glycosyltransferase involved in cell wall biosynthesis
VTPWISVIVPTRDRPEGLARALASVLEQTCEDVEVVVVDDGSAPPARERVTPATLADEPRLRWLALPRRARGHGAPFARNTGVAAARGRYLTMLDDDDRWTDPDHLARARQVLEAAEAADAPAELYFANQHAFREGARLPAALWLEPLGERLRAAGRRPATGGAFEVDVDDLLGVGGFCHLNTTIFARGLYDRIGGMDETLRYEPDRDIYLRAVDRAARMLYVDAVVARHDAPDLAKTANVSTALPALHKRLHQLRLLAKASIDSRHPALRRFALRHRGYTLKHMAHELAAAGRHREAAAYAREALGAAPGVKWLAYTLYLQVRLALRFTR